MVFEGAKPYGLGSWADIADHIGGCKTKDKVDRTISILILRGAYNGARCNVVSW